jgi:pilus assembly protein CpaB
LRRTSRLVLLAGVFLAALTFIVIILLLGNTGGTGTGGGAQPSAATTRQVVVAAQDIPLGTVVTAPMVTTTTVAITAVNAGAFQEPSQAIGGKNTVAITAGQQVTVSQFGNPTTIHPDPGAGKRAFSITVNQSTGAGNLVQVGDYVDVLISESISAVQKNSDGTVSAIPELNPLTVKMPLLVENIQVIGVIDEPVAVPANGQPAASAAPAISEAKKLLILAVTPQQAEVLLFARTSGTIDVVYRSANDTDSVTTDGVILKTLIDKYGVLPPNVVIVSVP